jgi:large repetitive protein
VSVLLNNSGAPATTTTLISSLNPATMRTPVTYTATVASQEGGAVTGTLTFRDGGSTIATAPVANNQATYSTTYTRGSVHTITATYSGDLRHMGSTSAKLIEHIASAASKTVVTTSGSPLFVGQAVTFTATVTSADGTIPDGELVTFYDGRTGLGSVALAGGTARYTTSSLPAKTHFIKTTYAGDVMFEPSAGLVKQVVDKYSTTTALSSSLNPSNDRQAVIFTATVARPGPTR